MSLDETFLEEIPPLKLAWWERKHLIEKAIERGEEEMSLDEVEERLDAGLAQIFVSENSIMIVEIKELALGLRFAHIWLAGGDMSELLELSKVAEEWARDAMGCRWITLSGPRWKGWSKVLEHRGYEVCLKKELDDDGR